MDMVSVRQLAWRRLAINQADIISYFLSPNMTPSRLYVSDGRLVHVEPKSSMDGLMQSPRVCSAVETVLVYLGVRRAFVMMASASTDESKAAGICARRLAVVRSHSLGEPPRRLASGDVTRRRRYM